MPTLFKVPTHVSYLMTINSLGNVTEIYHRNHFNLDCCTFQWRHINEETGEAAIALEDQYGDIETNDNKPPNVDIQNVEDPDDVLDDTVKTLDGTQNEENIVDNNTTNNEETNDTVVEEGQGENLDGGDQVE